MVGDLFCHAHQSATIPDTVTPKDDDILVGGDTLLLWVTKLEAECQIFISNNEVTCSGIT